MRLPFSKIGEIKDQLITVGLLLTAVLMMVARNDDAFHNLRKVSISTLSYLEAPLANVRVYRTALQTNVNLERQNILLQDEVNRLRSLREENEALRSLLELQTRSEIPLLPVKIVAKSLTGINNFVTINAGTADSVRTGMAVVNADGLIGQVTIVSENYAQVIPFFNKQFRTSAHVEGSRAYGIVSWNSDNFSELQLSYVPETIPVEPGMRVTTSGTSLNFPPNIPIGEVIRSEQEPGKETQRIFIRPFVSLFTVAEGHVVLFSRSEELENLENQWRLLFE